ncbi:hypothetical protein HanRHA438_Chr00c33g0855481 [Helianthus annuus]|uniref:Uncharacterized protein n=1 Tax=Helianthus annuus TaxID=4232 RepID=A0A9K3NEQ6_HELAN|nr:hypothetical protein HanXRQr2_Chr08g0355081 [Helianthus annuus]KAJ0540000.1 hypothetical protein HanHA300_Chr08g0293161 [Helianthus annuus]KAJ0548373.1 hypothetical protein HanIR_Chr08g0383041 [Helianthus annuus]KAJ0554735.1 hypothetical protein HanHA89_Chr08g0311591 [Helianthus annuus]KAJ0720302.1 hypothetical protein HanLR1_Chr08g0291931 [Helianthus annuus]
MQRIAKELECNEASRDGDLARECMRRIAIELECNEASRYGDLLLQGVRFAFRIVWQWKTHQLKGTRVINPHRMRNLNHLSLKVWVEGEIERKRIRPHSGGRWYQ